MTAAPEAREEVRGGPPPAPTTPQTGWLAGSGALTLLDQAAVSGTNFLTIVLIGRACGQKELGYYSLGFTAVVLLAALQEALVTAPYTVFRGEAGGKGRAEYAGTALVFHAALALLAAVALAAVAAVAVGPVGWAVAAVVPMALAREFCRRLAFAHLRVGCALALDLSVAGLQLGGLAWLAAGGRLNAVSAFAALGVACATAGLVCLALTRADFAVRGARVGRDLGRHWVFGRWVAAGQLVGVAHGYAVHWLLAGMLGPTSTGVFAACLAVVTLTNPFFLGVSNLLGPRAALALSRGGPAEVRRVVGRAVLLLVAVMGGFCGVVAVAGGLVMRVLCGEGYAGNESTLTVLAVASVVACPGMAADHGLRALGRPRPAFAGSLVGLVVTVAAAATLAAHWGVAGAACGYLMGTAASATLRVRAFLRLTAPTGQGRA